MAKENTNSVAYKPNFEDFKMTLQDDLDHPAFDKEFGCILPFMSVFVIILLFMII